MLTKDNGLIIPHNIFIMTRPQKTALALVFTTSLSLLIVNGFEARADENLLQSQEGYGDFSTLFGGEPEDLRLIIGKMVNVLLGFIGAIFLGLTIFAGFQYMTSGGNDEKTKKSVGLLKNAIIGLIIILAAWSITRFTVIIMSKTLNNTVDYTGYR